MIGNLKVGVMETAYVVVECTPDPWDDVCTAFRDMQDAISRVRSCKHPTRIVRCKYYTEKEESKLYALILPGGRCYGVYPSVEELQVVNARLQTVHGMVAGSVQSLSVMTDYMSPDWYRELAKYMGYVGCSLEQLKELHSRLPPSDGESIAVLDIKSVQRKLDILGMQLASMSIKDMPIKDVEEFRRLCKEKWASEVVGPCRSMSGFISWAESKIGSVPKKAVDVQLHECMTGRCGQCAQCTLDKLYSDYLGLLEKVHAKIGDSKKEIAYLEALPIYVSALSARYSYILTHDKYHGW